MSIPGIHDDTTRDYEQFEGELLSRDLDARLVRTADVDEDSAQRIATDLIEEGTVIPIPDQRVLIHDPTGARFDSILQLIVFHRGWQAARSD